MKRIFKVKETLSNFDETKTINLCVVNENGEDLQGKITVEKIDRVEYEPLEKTAQEKLYFVYNPMHEGKPQKIYDDYLTALCDAKDIAGKYDRCNIYVLQIVAEIEKKNFVHETIKERGEVIEESSWESVPF